MSESSVTDWVSAVGVLIAAPSAIFAMFKLGRKDKELERKLNSLETIAGQQAEIAKQMIVQSGQMQYQSSLMAGSNKLLEEQIQIQIDNFIHHKNITERALELENKKRISEIRPFFVTDGGFSSNSGFQIEFLNKGGDATDVTLELTDGEFVQLTPLASNLKVNNGKKFILNGSARLDRTYFTNNMVPFDIQLTFKDVDGNDYSQKVQRVVSGQVISQDPQLASNS
ncbi:MAG: hypothetical protein WBJ10_01625 [Daejeonella sp.]|uniref:hypothetical protein n=1 Tax=Daejeonella sp. TaxID=2805397 RepID=UPI003C71A437